MSRRQKRLALFEYLFFEFLEKFDVFTLSGPGRTRDHEPSELMPGYLHCYYHDIYGIVSLNESFRTRSFG